MVCDLECQSQLLLLVRTVYTFLHHAATVFVACNLHAFTHHGFVDELVVRAVPSKEDLLNDMVTVNVFS